MQTPIEGSAKPLSLVDRAQARRDELKGQLADTELSASTRSDIEAALGAVGSLLTGDLDKLPNTVKGDLNRWIENNRHLGIKADAHPEATAQAKPADSAIKAEAPAPTPPTVTTPQPKTDDAPPATA